MKTTYKTPMENFWEMFEQEIQKDGDHIVKGLIAKEVGRWYDEYTMSAEISQLCNKTIEFINELAAEEIRYIKNKKWSRSKQAKIKENYHKQKYSIWQALRHIETEAYMKIFQLPEPEKYRKARESFQTMCNIVCTKIELWLIIPDGIPDSSPYAKIPFPKK